MYCCKSTSRVSSRRGFTLLELLVVIGIIGILAGITLTQFSGVTEGAKASQCMNNLRGLAMATQTYALGHGDDEHFMPSAQTYKVEYMRGKKKSRKTEFYLRKGWISNNGDPDTINGSATAVTGTKPSFADSSASGISAGSEGSRVSEATQHPIRPVG